MENKKKMDKLFIVKCGSQYQCEICQSYISSSLKGIRLHLKYSHKVEKRKEPKNVHCCDFCHKNFTQEKFIKHHIKQCLR